MKCYFDDDLDAQGTCQKCGRMACRDHSEMIDDKFVCTGCTSKGSDNFLKAKKIIENYWNELEECEYIECSIRLTEGTYRATNILDDNTTFNDGEELLDSLNKKQKKS